MDDDVVEFLLWMLDSSPFNIPGTELARIADVHARAKSQIQQAAPVSAPNVD